MKVSNIFGNQLFVPFSFNNFLISVLYGCRFLCSLENWKKTDFDTVEDKLFKKPLEKHSNMQILLEYGLLAIILSWFTNGI